MRDTHKRLNINIGGLVSKSGEIYFPAIAGELFAGGEAMKEFAEAYVAEMREDGGDDHLLWVHVSLWSELVTALTIAACKEKTK